MIERTLVVIKPDGVERGLVDEIISRYEKAGLKVLAKKILRIDKKFAEKHYAATDEQIVGMGLKTLQASKENNRLEEMKKIFGTENPKEIGTLLRRWMIEFITSGSVVALLLEGEDAVQVARKITGYTDPSKAEKGTIRGDFGEDSIVKANLERRACRNLVHASGSKEEAEREIALWFGKNFK
jgi:nucleoside-diphosphate kinase